MRVSILVIAYNHEKYIQQALESVLMQKDFGTAEIVFCDDHSTDGTVAIARTLLSGFDASFWVNPENMGITKNYQRAFSMCRGEYIAVLEGDDYWIDPWKLKKQLDFLDAHPFCSMCSHPFIIQKKDEQIFDFPASSRKAEYTLLDSKELILDEGLISNFSTCCYRRAMLEKIPIRIFDTISYEWMVNISIGEFGFLARLNEPLSVYRHSESGSWTNMTVMKQIEGMCTIIPVYDDILDYRLHIYFEKKRQMLENRLKEFSPEKPSFYRKYLPPFIFSFVRGILPPAIRQKIK